MRVELVKPITKDSQGYSYIIDVWGNEEEPGADGVLLGSETVTFHPNSSPEDIAEGIHEKALELKEHGLELWELHNQVAVLLGQIEE